MRLIKSCFIALACVAFSQAVFAATFVVPSDRDMVHRAHAIVIGSALTSYTQLTPAGGIETVTPVSIEEVVKGALLPSTINVVEPGGVYQDRATIIPGIPRFEAGKRMLLLLMNLGPGRWVVSELVLGKFSFDTDRAGRKLLVRDEGEIVGTSPQGGVYREPHRDADRFLQFVRTETHGGVGVMDYAVPYAPLLRPATTSLAPETNIAPYTATSYSYSLDQTTTGTGSRWTVFPNAVNWFRGVTGEAGAQNNGDTAINAAMAAWDNDCPSNVNYVYAGVDDGTHTSGLNSPDGANTILFDQDLTAFGASAYQCSSGGTLGIGGITLASGTNTTIGETFNTTLEGDVMMNQGIANCTLLLSTNAGDWNSALTHEIGHTLGIRHSNQNRATPGGACDSSLECSSSAIMTAVITKGLNATLQTWDQHAVQAIYPASCGGAFRRGDFNLDNKTDLLWRNYSSGAVNVWFLNNTTYTGGTSLFTVADANWHIEGVGDFNGDGKSDLVWRNYSSGAVNVWFMNGTSYLGGTSLFTVADPNWQIEAVGDYNGDGKADLIWRNYSSGAVNVWFMNGTSYLGGTSLFTVADPNWKIQAIGDYNGDGKADLIWRNYTSGAVNVWFLNGTSYLGGTSLFTVADPNWKIEGP